MMFKTTGDFEDAYEKLHQGWHMQRALLEKQNIEIARLKKKDKLFSKNRRLLVETNKYFLSEMERLRKVSKEMLGYFNDAREGYCGGEKVKAGIMVNVRILEIWQQALKEK